MEAVHEKYCVVNKRRTCFSLHQEGLRLELVHENYCGWWKRDVSTAAYIGSPKGTEIASTSKLLHGEKEIHLQQS